MPPGFSIRDHHDKKVRMRHSVYAISLPGLFMLALAACEPVPTPITDTGECGADEMGALVGTPLAAVTLPADPNRPIRTLGPNDIMTMDFNPTRLNIFTDENGIITRLSCG